MKTWPLTQKAPRRTARRRPTVGGFVRASDRYYAAPDLYYAAEGWDDELETEAAKWIAQGKPVLVAWNRAKEVVTARRAAHAVPYSWIGRVNPFKESS